MYYCIDKMNRAGFKWTVNETLSLQREYELLGMSIDEIAEKHKRTPNAIMYKLDQEGFADYNVLYSNYHDYNAKIPVSRKNTSNVSLNFDYSTEVDDSELDDVNDEDYVDNSDMDDDDDYDSDYADEDDDYKQYKMDNLSQRVYNLETVVYEIQIAVNQLMKQQSGSKQSLSKSIF